MISDTMPGRFDHHLAPLPEPDLAELFDGQKGRLFEHELARYERRLREDADGRDEPWGAQLRENLKALLTDVGIECPVSMEGAVESAAIGIYVDGIQRAPYFTSRNGQWPHGIRSRTCEKKSVLCAEWKRSPGSRSS